MMEILKVSDEAIAQAAEIIRQGGVIIYPTDTVYGLGCDPSNVEAAKRVCTIKGRFDKPLPLACADVKDARRIVHFNRLAERVAARFWPGPLMVVLPAKVEYSSWVTCGASTIGVRVPDHAVSRRLAELSSGIIVSTSANKTGVSPPSTIQGAVEQLGIEVDLVLDGGVSPLARPSTVIDLSDGRLRLLRRGPISPAKLRAALLT
jgi:L-threonylcarbamoyladenylate synthase